MALSLLRCQAPESSEDVFVYTDLIRIAESQQAAVGNRLPVKAWSLGGDYRAVLLQHAPSRVLVRDIPSKGGSGCRLRFALGLAESAWDKSDGVTFRIWARDTDSASEDHLLFEQFLDPSQHPRPRWEDHEVDLGSRGPQSLDLRFETDPGPAGDRDFDQAAWAAPHVVCSMTLEKPTTPEHPHVVLISLDTLRADHLGLYGYERPTSPHLDAFASQSLVFDAAFAPAPWTLPSHASMFTGLYPSEHGAGHANTQSPLGPNIPTLAEILSRAGYRTVGFSAGGLMSHRYGLARGFDVWIERQRVNSRAILPAVFDQIRQAPTRPLFLFFHTYDIHGPYNEWNGTVPPELSNGTRTSDQEWQRITKIPYHRYLKLERGDNLGEVIAAYDTGIRTVDGVVGLILDRLRKLKLLDHTVVIVTSDHGESLYDRKLYIGHSYQLTEEEIRIPLIIRFPDGEPRGRTPVMTSLVDLLPMVLASVEVPFSGPLSGSNPLLRLQRPERGSHAVRGEASHTGARYVRTSNWKTVAPAYPIGSEWSELPKALRDRFDPSGKLFHIAEDPQEQRNLWGFGESLPKVALRLRAIASELPMPGSRKESTVPMDAEAVRALRALGYLQ